MQSKELDPSSQHLGNHKQYQSSVSPQRGEVSAQNWQHFWENSCWSEFLAVRMPGNRPSSCALQGVKKQRFHPPHFQRQYPLSFRIPRLLHLVLWNLCLDQFVPHSVKKCKKKILGMRCFPSTSYPFRMLPSTGCVSITRKKKSLPQLSKCGLKREMD